MDPLQAVENAITALTQKRNMIEQSIIALENAAVTLRQVYVEPLGAIPASVAQFVDAADVGITDAVRGAFRLNADRKLTATQVREIVASHGFDLSKYTNAMATIHQVITRLKENEEIDGPFSQGSEKVHQWREPKGILARAARRRHRSYLEHSSPSVSPLADSLLENLLKPPKEDK